MMNFSLQSFYAFYRGAIRNSKYRWWIILGTLVYLLSPLDISPDMIPIIGQLDDVVLVTLLLTEVSQLVMERIKPRSTTTAASSASSESSSGPTVEVDAVTLE